MTLENTIAYSDHIQKVKLGDQELDSSAKLDSNVGFQFELQQIRSRETKASKDPPSTKERLGAIMGDLKKGNYKLESGIRSQFESLIKEADSGKSPLELVLEKRLAEKSKEFKDLTSPEKTKEAKELEKEINDKVKALDPKQQAEIGGLMFFRKMAKAQAEMSGEDPKSATEDMDKKLNELVPGVTEKLDKLEGILNPIMAKTMEAVKLQNELNQEKEKATESRIGYAWVLHLLGDGKQDDIRARQLLRESAVRDPKILADKYFQDLANRLGLDEQDFLFYNIKAI